MVLYHKVYVVVQEYLHNAMCMARVEEEKDNGTFVSGVRDGIRARISLLQDLFLLLAKWPLRF